MVGFESLTQGVIVLVFYSMYDFLFMQLNYFSGLVRFLLPDCSWFIYSVMFIIAIRMYRKLPPLTGGLLVDSDTGRSYFCLD
jgi:hypothetical protein